MFLDWTAAGIFVRPGATDLGKQINVLATMARPSMKVDSSKSPNRIQELQKMIRQMAADHEQQLRGMQESLQQEHNEHIEQ
jgi:F0F1-type ATP synthase epsilon subunit